jgi:RecB family endonuclease NucS
VTAEPDEHPEGELTISNEFTSVRLRKIRTRNGEVLQIESLRVDHVARLDALVLESLTWRSQEDLAKGLETPFGPDHDVGSAS